MICRLALITAVAMLAACGGSQPPIGALDHRLQAEQLHPRSEMRRQTSNQDLFYVSYAGQLSGGAYVYTYPAGKRVGSITGLGDPGGECVDSAGDVFIASHSKGSYGSSTIYEYAHGGTYPIAALDDPGVGFGCSVDPTTGNLAVANNGDNSNPYGGYGDVAVYKGAQGEPTMYYSSSLFFYYCGYDDAGNLYISAYPYGGNIYQRVLVRLANASKSFDLVSVDKTIYAINVLEPSVQWDGKYLTISSGGPDVSNGTRTVKIYRLTISGSSASVVGTTKLKRYKHAGRSGQQWIYGGAVLGISNRECCKSVSYWPYPKGGRPTYTIQKVLKTFGSSLEGVTVSVAPSR